MAIRILLADDHRITRDGLGNLIARDPEMTVVAEAENGRLAVSLAREHVPDVVIMDIGMPGLNGIEATRQILAENPTIRIIALSMHSDRRIIARILKAGASAYLLKDCASFEELATAVRTVVAGKVYLSPEIATPVWEDFIRFLSCDDAPGREN